MKIIADTNIWYDFGYGHLNTEELKEPLCPTFISISELLITEGVAEKIELLRPSIRALFTYKEHVIFDPPLIYLARMTGYKPENDIPEGLMSLLRASELIAKGHGIDKSKEQAFLTYVNGHKKKFDEGAETFNNMAVSIKEKFVNKIDLKKHRKEETLEINKRFLSHIVSSVTEGRANLDGLDFSKIELLLHTLDYFFKELETTNRKMQPNDWNDLFQLAYVQPGDLFWTHETRWNRLITEAGMEQYLYEKLESAK